MKKLERLAVYEQFFHKINLFVTSMNSNRIREAVSLIDDWSYVHRVGNGDLTLKEQAACVDEIIEKMKKF